MSKTDQLITSLTDDIEPIKSKGSPWVSIMIWLIVTVCSCALLFMFSSPRDDIRSCLSSPLYIMEIISLVCMILTLALSSLWLSYPDIRQQTWMISLPLFPALLFLVLQIYRVIHPESGAMPISESEHGFHCILCIILYALIPGFWLFKTIRSYATTHPKLEGAIVLASSASLGLLMLKIIEKNDSAIHLFVWHLMPIIFLSLIGCVLGKKYLTW